MTPDPIDSLVETIRNALTMGKDTIVERRHTKGIAALTELAERVKAAERENLELRGCCGDANVLVERAEAQRDELVEALEGALANLLNPGTVWIETVMLLRAALAKVRSEAEPPAADPALAKRLTADGTQDPDDFLPIGHPTC